MRTSTVRCHPRTSISTRYRFGSTPFATSRARGEQRDIPCTCDGWPVPTWRQRARVLTSSWSQASRHRRASREFRSKHLVRPPPSPAPQKPDVPTANVRRVCQSGGLIQRSPWRCVPGIHYRDGRVTQFHGGVLATTTLSAEDTCGLIPYDRASFCSPHVLRRDTSGTLLEDRTGYTRFVRSPPTGFRAIDPTIGATFVSELRDDERIFAVMIGVGPRVVCTGWKTSDVRSSEHELTGRLVADPDSPLVDYAFRAPIDPHSGPVRITLKQAVWAVGERVLQPLWGDDDAVTMARQALDASVESVGPQHLERWFFSRESCEVARRDVSQRLSEAPWDLSALGIHAALTRPAVDSPE